MPRKKKEVVKYYVVRYEIEAVPSSVIIDLVCTTDDEASTVYNDRLNRTDLKNVEMLHLPLDK